MADKKRFYRIAMNMEPGNSYVEDPEDAMAQLEHMMEDAPEGEGYTITVVYMTREEYEALEEFDGF